MKRLILWCVLIVLVVGCNAPSPDSTSGEKVSLPVFSVATSEYPSWSTLMVAGKAGLVNPEEGGEPGELEKKWKVDVVVQVKDYDPCLALYANNAVDAVCMTNMDSLNPSLARPSTAICPTSTSFGADKVVAVGVDKIEDLKGLKVYGLAKSVSEYLFVRGIEAKGLNPADFSFQNLDPAPAATALQTGSNDVKAICVWNPFALQTVRTAKNSKVVFDSTVIPGEIVDMIVVANDSIKKEGGEAFACCLCDIFYEVNKRLRSDNQETADATLTALGQDFSNLPLEDMQVVIQETKFYWTPQDGIDLFKGQTFPKTMETVVKTCQKIGVLEKDLPTIGYGDSTKQLNFDVQYMEKVAQGN